MVEDFPAGNKLFGFYIGQVLKQLPHGKCKLWIPSVYPVEWRSNPSLVPDAEQASPLFGGSFGGNGVFSWPDVGSIVWCFFKNGDQNYPVYFAAANGGIDAYDQYVNCSNADPDFLNETGDDELLSSGLELSRVHRLNSGKSSLTMFEDGTVSAKTEFPTQASTGTLGANCTYGEHLAHFYADKGLWSNQDIQPVENGTLRVALTIKKDGATGSFKSAFKADADSKPPAIDVFFYAEGHGSPSAEEQKKEDTIPLQDSQSPKQAESQKKGLYFCTVGKMYDAALGSKYGCFGADVRSIEAVRQQLEFAAKERYELFVCQADNFLSMPIVKDYDMASKREIQSRKAEVQTEVKRLASEYGISILAICPKHTWSDFVMADAGYMSACTFNDFTQVKSTFNVDVDGKLSAFTCHELSADMMMQDSWQDLGRSFSRASVDSAGNTFLDGVYTTKTSEVSCIFDMTTKEHIKAELNSAEVDPDSRQKKKAVVCAYDCDTKDGAADLSVVFYDYASGKKTYSKIRMTKDGEVTVNCTEKLDVLVKTDTGSTKSHMSMHQNGKIKVDSTSSIDISAPSISIEGDKVVMNGKTSTSITGKTGDCKIERVSLVKHKHHCGNGTTNVPIKQ